MQRVMLLWATGFSLALLAAPPHIVCENLVEDSPQYTRCPTPPALIVWTSRSCIPCRTFWNDLQSDPSFRNALTTRYRLQWIDADFHRDAAVRTGIHSVPAFQTSDQTVTGYQGKQWLWDQLTVSLTEDEPDDSATGSLQSDVDQVQSELIDEQSGDSPAPLPPLLRLPRTYAEPSAESPEPRQESSSDPTPEMLRESINSPTSPPNTLSPQHTQCGSFWTRLTRGFTLRAPIALTALELAGLISGTAVTGGVGTFAITVLWRFLQRRRQREQAQGTADTTRANDPQQEEETRSAPSRAPFPRQLDEARELLALRQSEGRVAVLDALRGMFLDDELAKLRTEGSDSEVSVANELQTRIDNRVDEVAPLSTTVETD